MNKNEFISALQNNGINSNLVCFNDYIKDDVFCVIESYGKIEIFYRERGKEFFKREFEVLSDALNYLLGVMTGKII